MQGLMKLISLNRLKEWFVSLPLQQKRIFAAGFYMLIMAAIAFAGKGVSAATVSTTGTGADFYNTILGFIFGPPGIIIGILVGSFGALMLIKHWLITIFAVLALVIFYSIPYLVLMIAGTGAASSGAMI